MGSRDAAADIARAAQRSALPGAREREEAERWASSTGSGAGNGCRGGRGALAASELGPLPGGPTRDQEDADQRGHERRRGDRGRGEGAGDLHADARSSEPTRLSREAPAGVEGDDGNLRARQPPATRAVPVLRERIRRSDDDGSCSEAVADGRACSAKRRLTTRTCASGPGGSPRVVERHGMEPATSALPAQRPADDRMRSASCWKAGIAVPRWICARASSRR